MNTRITLTAIAFLALVALSNILVGEFGQEATPYVAFALVGPILVLRDGLHDAWATTRAAFAARMAALVAAGAGLAYLTGTLFLDAGPMTGKIAVASMIAFAVALTVDTVVYASLRRAAVHVRVNISNAVSSLADSFAFIGYAFGLAAVESGLVFEQFTAKVAGGALFLALIWAFVSDRAKRESVA